MTRPIGTSSSEIGHYGFIIRVLPFRFVESDGPDLPALESRARSVLHTLRNVPESRGETLESSLYGVVLNALDNPGRTTQERWDTAAILSLMNCRGARVTFHIHGDHSRISQADNVARNVGSLMLGMGLEIPPGMLHNRDCVRLFAESRPEHAESGT